MPTTATLLQFAVASLLLAVTPGPSVVLLLAIATDRGRRAGAVAAVGLAVGTLAWVVVTAAGLGALLAARPGLLSGITAVGGGYLLWLGIERFRAPAAPPADLAEQPVGAPLRDGLVVNLLNPSLTIFLASVTPPFLALDRGPVWQQVLVLGVVLVLVSTVVNVGWAVLGAAIGRRARRWVGSRRTAVAVGCAYTALAAVAFASAAMMFEL